jgi:pimeloyl-ACP methyl ester carboxylesterase
VFAEVGGGQGPLIVALHGWGRDHRDFQAVLSAYPHLLIDLPGFGFSPAPPDAWGAADYASCVAAVLDQHGSSQPVAVVGHSFGGRVAVCLAASRPELVHAMVLVGVPLLRPPGAGKPPIGFRLGRRAHRLGLLSDRRIEAMRGARGSADYNAAAGVMRQTLVRVVNESYEAQLAAIGCPVGLLWGSGDRAVPVGVIERVSRLLATRVATDVVDGVGHDVHLLAPDRLQAMIATVLEAGRLPRCW